MYKRKTLVLKTNSSLAFRALSGCVVTTNESGALEAFLLCFSIHFTTAESTTGLTGDIGSSSWTPTHLMTHLTLARLSKLWVCFTPVYLRHDQFKTQLPLESVIIFVEEFEICHHCHINQGEEYRIRPSGTFSFRSKTADKLVQVTNTGLRRVVVRYHCRFSCGNIGLRAMRRWQQQHWFTGFVPIRADCIVSIVIVLQIATCAVGNAFCKWWNISFIRTLRSNKCCLLSQQSCRQRKIGKIIIHCYISSRV